jgi:hypothetical protein
VCDGGIVVENPDGWLMGQRSEDDGCRLADGKQNTHHANSKMEWTLAFNDKQKVIIRYIFRSCLRPDLLAWKRI